MNCKSRLKLKIKKGGSLPLSVQLPYLTFKNKVMSKNSKLSRKEQFIEKRKALIALSKMVRPLVEQGEFDTVNEAIKEQYLDLNTEITEFKTFGQWKQEGATVRKGEKAFLVWGQPRKIEQVPEGSDEPEEFKYWPVCYLFANTQVHIPDQNIKQHVPQPVEEMETVNGDDI